MTNKLIATINEVELDKDGAVIALKGSCKASDIKPKENIFRTLGIDWVDC